MRFWRPLPLTTVGRAEPKSAMRLQHYSCLSIKQLVIFCRANFNINNLFEFQNECNERDNLCFAGIPAVFSYLTTASAQLTHASKYGIPLLSYAKLAFPFVSAGAINYFVHLTQPATPQETTVVLPNVDTLYSAAVFDLSSHDINVTIPSIDADRYWSFAFYDP